VVPGLKLILQNTDKAVTVDKVWSSQAWRFASEVLSAAGPRCHARRGRWKHHRLLIVVLDVRTARQALGLVCGRVAQLASRPPQKPQPRTYTCRPTFQCRNPRSLTMICSAMYILYIWPVKKQFHRQSPLRCIKPSSTNM
jgi:hypothetical protein